MVLADHGADVIKIERPGRGDEFRGWGPPFTDAGESVYFLAVNRNKRSISLDLATPRGRELFLRLCAAADVVVDNFRPGTMAGLRLDDGTLRAVNPRLVTCSLTAFGTRGPYRDLPGYDIVLQAVGGIMSVTGEPDGRPVRAGFAAADVLAGLYLTIGVLTALRAGDASGVGQRVELSMLGAELASLVNVVANYLVAGQVPERLGNAHPSIAPYDVYRTADGYLAIAVTTESRWAALCETLERPGLATDPRFRTNGVRVQRREALRSELEAVLETRATIDWTDRLRLADLACGPVNAIDEILGDPQVAAEGLVVEVTQPGRGPIRTIASPLRFDGRPPSVRGAPALGDDTDAVLRDLAGVGDEELAALRAEGVI